MSTGLFGKEFGDTNDKNIKIQNKLMLQTFIRKIISNNDNDEFIQYIKKMFPIENINKMSDKTIQENILRLKNMNSILESADLTNDEIIYELFNGLFNNFLPKFERKFPDYQFMIQIINKNLRKILAKTNNQRINTLNKLQYISNNIVSDSYDKENLEIKSIWISVLEGLGITGMGFIGYFLVQKYIINNDNIGKDNIEINENKRKLENEEEYQKENKKPKMTEICYNMESFQKIIFSKLNKKQLSEKEKIYNEEKWIINR